MFAIFVRRLLPEEPLPCERHREHEDGDLGGLRCPSVIQSGAAPTSGRGRSCGGPAGPMRRRRRRCPLQVRIQTARDLLGLLEEQLNALRGDAALGTVERARSVGALAGVALRAIETADLEQRVEALEAVLAGRTKRR